MVKQEQAPDRGALIGATVAGTFGVAWSVWAASGLSGTARIVVAAVGVVVGLFIAVASVRVRRSVADRGGKTMFSSRSYRLIVVAEIVAIGVGAGVLSGAGRAEYIPVWVAVVVSVHFFGFGHFFWSGFYLVGTAVLLAAVVGELVGLSGRSPRSVAAATGVIAAISLFAAGGRGVVRAQAAVSA